MLAYTRLMEVRKIQRRNAQARAEYEQQLAAAKAKERPTERLG